MTPKALRKYLAREAEPEARAVLDEGGDGDSQATFGHVVVVPVYGEGAGVLPTLASIPRGPLGPVLVLLVLNARDDSPPWVHEQNRASVLHLTSTYGESTEWQGTQPAEPLGRRFVGAPGNGTLWLLDRATTHRFPEGQGVGLARKVGLDIALALTARGRVRSRFLHTTDADAILPEDYFARAAQTEENVAALTYPFVHDTTGPEGEAARLYDLFLRYYVAGLTRAGSPYNFHTVGSTLAVAASSYAEVRGFPKRAAGEDFYLLNKLAKVGSIRSLAGEPIGLSGRASDRVPFGTGRSVARIAALLARGERYCVYHPDTFAYLGAWLAALRAGAESGASLRTLLRQQCETAGLLTNLATLAVDSLGAFEALEALRARGGPPAAILRSFHTWFDAFRTRKLVHALRDQSEDGLTPVPIEEVGEQIAI